MDLWESIFPNPNGILGLPVETGSDRGARSGISVQRLRQQTISPGAEPFLRSAAEASSAARGATLIAEDGRRYLDMVNNVRHVGHAIRAWSRRLRGRPNALNTNTRYLHDNLIRLYPAADAPACRPSSRRSSW